MKILRLLTGLLIVCLTVVYFAPAAMAFCGFYVAKADTKLYNKASQVVIAKDGKRTILTMANDFQGDVKDFALVVPVPQVLQKEQVRIGDSKVIEHLDAFSAPRLVEYFDADPCAPVYRRDNRALNAAPSLGMLRGRMEAQKNSGVTIEAQFSVGEYDIVILSAKESSGLETWLTDNGYIIPANAQPLLQPYIRQNMKFFVAKVNLTEFSKSGAQFLRPIMIAYESPKFMLPIRLGMTNAIAEQDLLVYVLSPKGQAEVTNYRTVKVPSDAEIPVFVKNEFGDFYKSMFKTAYGRENKKAVFLEYAWDMSSCDPCSAEPLTNEELKKAGVFWLNSRDSKGVFITRLHVRYTRDDFPEDLMFKETPNRESFQGRFVLRHAFNGNTEQCSAGREYKRSLPQRYEREAQTLAKLTQWDIEDIRSKINIAQTTPFWRDIWQ